MWFKYQSLSQDQKVNKLKWKWTTQLRKETRTFTRSLSLYAKCKPLILLLL